MDYIFDFSFSTQFASMLLRFLISMAVTWLIADKLYFSKSHRRDFYFTFMLISVAIFFLVFFMIFVLEDLKAKTSIGIGIGLFGIFSIMRYRTDAIPVREMTYLFVIVALSVVNAIGSEVTLSELLVTNALVVLSIWLCERQLKPQPSKLVQYDRIELIKPERRDELTADIESRLGLKVTHIEVGGVDMLKDMAVLRVYYLSDGVSNTVDSKLKLSRADMANVQ